MDRLIDSLASLKLAVVLLILLLLGLAAGTIIESSRGVEAAGRLVYYSFWFLTLQCAVAINVLASIIRYFPWGKYRVGFLITHASLIFIFCGAIATYFFKIEGQIMLWEGQSANEITTRDGQGRIVNQTALPFSIKLDDFRVDHYPGTMRPANFRSDVTITDPDGSTVRAAIWMNHEFEHQGWRMFQSSYRQEKDREATVLSVSRDPGQLIVFIGYIFLLVGMCIVIATRLKQTRMRERFLASQVASAAKTALFFLCTLLCLPVQAEDAMIEALRRLPIQHDGRVMPLETLAREAVWNITGRHAASGAAAVATVAGWWFDPRTGGNEPVVLIGDPALAVAAGLPVHTKYASFLQLVNSQPLLQLIERARTAAQRREPLKGELAAAQKLEDRLLWMQGFLSREKIRPIPVAGDPTARWLMAPESDADLFLALAKGSRLPGWPSSATIERELTYNTLRPTRLAWIILSVALLFSVMAWNRRSPVLGGVAFVGQLAGFAVMSWGIWTRWNIADRIPAANMYESLLFLGWGVGLFTLIAFAFMRNRLVIFNANAMAALTMMLTDLLPIDGFIHPVPPVLAGTVWLAIHVPIIMVSYSVLALGVVIAHLRIGFSIFVPGRTETIGRMDELLYWYIMVGSLLLIAGILTGSMWAASSWGRYWGWDPKEVWSLVAFLAYIAILHARWDRMLGPFGVAAISIAAFQTILMTYLGVNYVLTTGLHSYGFGDSPVVTWMILVAVVEMVFLLVGWLIHRRQISGGFERVEQMV